MTSITRSYPDPAARHRAAAWPAVPAWVGPLYVSAFTLACFLPYPALSIGSSNGLQISQAMTLLAVPVLAARAPGRPLVALVALLTPVFASALFNTMRTSTPEPEVLLKEAVSLSLALVVLWPGGWLARRDRFRAAMGLAAVAIVGHALLGLYQVYAFSHEEFPLLWLYRNPSFKEMESWSDLYARYIKRPCGLFPEPSAMASALGPWLAVLTGRLAGSATGMPARDGTRWLTFAAVAAGTGLLVLSRSGAVLAVMLGAFVTLAGRPWPFADRRQQWLFWGGAALAAPLVLAGLAVYQFSSGLDQRIESSWGLRSKSIVEALTANREPVDLLTGVGAGQSPTIIRRAMNGVPRPKDQDDMAVFSLAACYYMENGLIGAAALLGVLVAAVRAVYRSSARALGAGGLIAWIVAVTVTTSYMALPSVWLFLAAALSWDSIFPRNPRAEVPSND